jgi:elongation factor Ts
MAQITASQVKELRERTSAGMMDCKKALVNTNGDIEQAIIWLRENGITKAAKKAGRIAAEGICKVVNNDKKAVIFELNSETDFVAKNDKFQVYAAQIGDAILNSEALNTEEALEIKVDDKTLADLVIEATATIGEKISLRRVNVFTKEEEQEFSSYIHMGGKIAVLTVYSGSEDVAHDICMHIAAMSPTYLDESEVDAAHIAQERIILVEETRNEGKPEKIIDKIVDGKIKKLLKGICLLDQPFVKNQDQTVGEFLKANNTKIAKFIRLEVGEGIEKKQDDFAAEVMAAVNN